MSPNKTSSSTGLYAVDGALSTRIGRRETPLSGRLLFVRHAVSDGVSLMASRLYRTTRPLYAQVQRHPQPPRHRGRGQPDDGGADRAVRDRPDPAGCVPDADTRDAPAARPLSRHPQPATSSDARVYPRAAAATHRVGLHGKGRDTYLWTTWWRRRSCEVALGGVDVLGSASVYGLHIVVLKVVQQLLAVA